MNRGLPMSHGRNTMLLTSLLAMALAIAALCASTAPAAVWTIEGKTLTELGLKEESVASTAAPFTIEVPKLTLKVECEAEKGSGKIISPSTDEATMELSKCKVFEPKTCTVSEPVVIKAKTELIKKAGIVYDFLKPLTGEAFGTLTLKGEACPFPKELKLTGSTAGQLGLEEIAKQPLKFSKAIAEAAGTSMLAGASPAFFIGTSNRELSGAHKGAKWGACALCGLFAFAAEEGYGASNPAEPNVVRSFEGNQINLATGNLVQTQTDLTTGGRAPALELTRYYNSRLAATAKSPGAFGYGWTSTYSASLVVNEGAETATVRNDNGSTALFYLVEGKYQAAPWIQAKLAKEGANYIYTLPDQLKLTFNSTGQLTKVTERHGNAITLAYNGKSQLETATDGAGRKLTFAYNAGGQVESVKDPMGHLAKYSYESSNLATVTLPEEKLRWKFGYDASHQITGLTDGRSHTTSFEYDASQRVKLEKDALERKRTIEYPSGTETKVTEPNKAVTIGVFNSAGEPTSMTRASGTGLAATTSSEYDSSFNRIAITDPNTHTTKYGYDAEGNRTSEKDANGNESKWTYNSTHDVKTATTPKGETTTFVRNAAGDPEVIERPAPGATIQKTTYEYAANGDLKSETDPIGRATSYEYDTYGDRKAETNAAGDKRTRTYNENSQLVSEVSPRGNEAGGEPSKFETKFELSAQGQQLTVTDPQGGTTKYVYDGNGNTETVTDPNTHTTTNTYDAIDQLTKVKAPNGDITETGYDSMGQVTSRTNGGKKTTKYERDLLGRVTEEIDPLERKTIKEYDAAGNLKTLKDAESRTTTYTYDSGNRVTKISYSEVATPSVTYEYDKDGNLTVMTDGTGTTKNQYDELGRLTEVENGNKEISKYGYDLANQQTSITYPNGKVVTRGYDNAGRLEKVTDWLKGETKFSYTRDSQLKTATYPTESGNKDEYVYNNLDQPTKITMTKGAETLASLTYTRDKLGQLESVTQTSLPGAEKVEYGYDTRDRLTKAGTTTFEYDGASNPTKVGAATYVYDNASQPEKGGGVTFTYSKVGTRTKATPESGPATTYGYDQAGNLRSVERPEEGKVKAIKDTYTYDGTGLRSAQTISGVTTHLAWSISSGLPELLSDGTNSYIYGPGGLPIEQINGEGKVFYLHHDQLGSTRLLTGATGKNEGAYSFTPYGGIEAQSGTATTPLGFTGQYTNSSTGLIYLRARTYDPVTAQFLSVDPLIASTGERYNYAAGNPVNRTDPTGLDTWGGCVEFTGEIPLLVGSATVCLVRDGGGQWAITLTGAGSIGFNTNLIDGIRRWATPSHITSIRARIDVNLSGRVQWSNSRTVGGLAGPFSFCQVSGGYGVTAGYETFWGGGVRGRSGGGGWSFGWRFSFSTTHGTSYSLIFPVPI
ncbi:MAG TPA: RHS repeat-associated core domain-containing protein [Solirubrobacterales bacterium]